MGATSKVVLIDLGGVLMEFAYGPSDIVGPDQFWEKWLKSRSVRRFETGNIGEEEFFVLLIKEMELGWNAQDLRNFFYTWPVGWMEGAKEVLQSLTHCLAKTVILANTNPIHWSFAINKLQVDRYVDALFPSHKTGVLKPDSKAFSQVADCFECQPSEILYFDDNEIHVEAANLLGLKAFHTMGVDKLVEETKGLV